MRAYRVVLTHFSQRYPGVLEYDVEEAAAPRAVPAFDGMRFNLQELPGLPDAAPALVKMSAKYFEAMERKGPSKKKKGIKEEEQKACC